jgi:hypothetical protein
MFRKKPVQIEAVQWTENMSMRELIDFTNGLVKLNDVDRDFHVYDRLHDTWVKFEYGDWIIRGVAGEFYPCRDDIFAVTYEPVATPCQASSSAPNALGNERCTLPVGHDGRHRDGTLTWPNRDAGPSVAEAAADNGPPCIPDHSVPVSCPGCEYDAASTTPEQDQL